ncbi:MAG: hypothetical protein NTY53_26880 [Kiritimatiellaeota bacterium]|nr:hypothetical protein [Kiritimatiellota bacterium]
MKAMHLVIGALLCAAAAFAVDTPPVLMSPPNGMELTDVATYFQWQPVAGCTNFEIQIARDATFTELVKTKHTVNKGYHKNLYFPKDLLPPGAYCWRVRELAANQPGPWSEVRALKVNAEHPVLPQVVRTIGPTTPLFLMRSRAWDPLKHTEHVKEIIPPGLERVIVVDDLALASGRVFERAQRYQELGLDFVLWNNRCQVSLATLEYLFQHFSHCVGTAEGEHFDGITWERGPEGNLAESDFVHRAWTLCAKYGRFYFFADGDAGSYRWPNFVTRDREYFERYRRNIVPMFKTTKGDLALHSYGAVQGLMADGLAENCGTWVDEWIWPECGFGKLGEVIPEDARWANRRKVGTKQCPWVYDLQMWLMGIASGSTVFHLESAHQWTPDGSASKNYSRFFLPFVKAVVEHQLIPSRAAFLDSIRLAVNPDPELTKGKHQKQYAGGYAFLRDLYALKAPGDQELIPNSSRYGIVCLLPPGTTNLAGRTRVLAQRDLLDPARAAALFNAAYPQRFTGDAFMWECDGTVIVTDSNENQDVPQKFALPFERGLVRSLGGVIGVHEYVIGKIARDGNSFWFQTNGENPDRALDIALTCARQPIVKIEPPSAAQQNAWDAATKTLKLRLSHQTGAVEVTLR